MCHHRRNQKYKCRRCTYSSNNNKAVRFHMNCHHLDGPTSEKKMKLGPVSLKVGLAQQLNLLLYGINYFVIIFRKRLSSPSLVFAAAQRLLS